MATDRRGRRRRQRRHKRNAKVNKFVNYMVKRINYLLATLGGWDGEPLQQQRKAQEALRG